MKERQAQKLEQHMKEMRTCRYLALWAASQIPKRHQDNWAKLSEPDEMLIPHPGKPPWDAAFREGLRVAKDGGILVFLGDRGTGKTQLAVTIIREFTFRGVGALYRRWQDIVLALRACFAKKAKQTDAAVIDMLAARPLLVIDEIQEQGRSDFDERTMTHLIDLRYGAKLPTVLIGNLTVEQYAEIVGPSILDRTKETGAVIVCDWPSFRGGV